MRKSKFIILLLFFAFKVTTSFSQVDTVFWFGAPWVTVGHANNIPLALQISTFSNPTTVRLRQPAGTYDTTFVVAANTNFTKILSYMVNQIETTPANTVLNRGLKITSNFPITVVYDNITVTNNPETYSMKGQNGLGTEFVCPFQTHRNNGGYSPTPKSQIIIVATDYNTVVWITPKCNVVGHPANITYSVALGYGQTYNIENVTNASSVAGQNLSGTIIVSNKPVAVTVADDSVSGVSGCFDLMGDQLVPVDIVGTDYIINKGGLNAAQYEGPYIVATENLTQVTITDAVVTTTLLNKGDTYFYKVTQPLTYVQATKNVYVLHESGFGCELGEAILPPLNCAGSNQVAFTRNNSQPFYLNILCKNGSQGTFTLNGSSTLIPVSAFTVVPGTGGQYYGAQIQFNTTDIPVGTANLISNATDVFALGIFHGGASSGALYHYMSSFLRRTTVTASTVAPVCVGQTPTVALTGTISGGAITGVWTTANGTGTLGVYTSTANTIATSYTLSNADTLLSSIKFYLTSTGNCTPKKDSIYITVNQRPKVFVGSNVSMCKNNVLPVSLSGTVTNALGGTWSGGNGGAFGVPGVNTTYTPSPADISSGMITLTLTSSGPLAGCVNSSKTVTLNFLDPPNVSAGPSTFVCTNSQSLILSGSVTGVSSGTVWSTNGTGLFFPNSSSPTATYVLSASDLTATALSFTLTATDNINNCAAVQNTLGVNIIGAPVVSVPNNFTVCAKVGVITLTGNVSGSASQGTWYTPNGTGVFNQLPPANATYTMSQNDTLAGNVTFVLGSTGTLCPTTTDTVKVAILKAPLVQVNPNNQAVCNNAPIALTGTVSGYTNSGIWSSTGTGAFTPTNTALGGQYFPSSGDVSNGSVVLTLSSTNNQGCPASSSSFVAVFVAAPKAFLNADPVRCAGTGILFTDGSLNNGTSSLTFTTNFGDGTPASSSSFSFQTHTFTNPGSYIVTYTVVGTNTTVVPPLQCPDTVSKRITVYPTPIPAFNFNNACSGLPTYFYDSSIVSVGNIVKWNWSFGDASTNATIKNPTHTYTTQGTFFVNLTVTSNYSCSAQTQSLVTVNPQPNAEFGMTNNPAVAQEPIYFSDFSTPTASLSSWYWTFGDEGSSTSNNPSHSYNNAGIYVVTLTVFDNNGCSDSISKSIEITLLPQVPTAFTPNGDGNNDLLFVKGGPFQKMLFRVYDNWGQLMFETTDQKIGWDGKKNGVDQPVGVYVWTLEVDLYNNRQVKKNGDITIIR